MPSINNSVLSGDNDNIRAQLENRQQKSKKHYDKHTTEKEELHDNQPVRVRNQETRLC